MIRHNQSNFRTGSSGPAGGGGFLNGAQFNLADYSLITGAGSNPFVGSHTQGAALIDQVDTQQGNEAHIHALSVTAQLFLSVFQVPLFGKLGRIYAGLILQGAQTRTAPGSFSLPLSAPIGTIPPEPYRMIIWDPAVDPLPPLINNDNTTPQPPFLTIGGELSFPQEIPFWPGGALCIGLWIEPALVSAIGVGGSPPSIIPVITNARYALTTDQ